MSIQEIENETYPYRLPVFKLENNGSSRVVLNEIEIEDRRCNVNFNNNALRILRKKETVGNLGSEVYLQPDELDVDVEDNLRTSSGGAVNRLKFSTTSEPWKVVDNSGNGPTDELPSTSYPAYVTEVYTGDNETLRMDDLVKFGNMRGNIMNKKLSVDSTRFTTPVKDTHESFGVDSMNPLAFHLKDYSSDKEFVGKSGMVLPAEIVQTVISDVKTFKIDGIISDEIEIISDEVKTLEITVDDTPLRTEVDTDRYTTSTEFERAAVKAVPSSHVADGTKLFGSSSGTVVSIDCVAHDIVYDEDVNYVRTWTDSSDHVVQNRDTTYDDSPTGIYSIDIVFPVPVSYASQDFKFVNSTGVQLTETTVLTQTPKANNYHSIGTSDGKTMFINSDGDIEPGYKYATSGVDINDDLITDENDLEDAASYTYIRPTESVYTDKAPTEFYTVRKKYVLKIKSLISSTNFYDLVEIKESTSPFESDLIVYEKNGEYYVTQPSSGSVPKFIQVNQGTLELSDSRPAKSFAFYCDEYKYFDTNFRSEDDFDPEIKLGRIVLCTLELDKIMYTYVVKDGVDYLLETGSSDSLYEAIEERSKKYIILDSVESEYTAEVSHAEINLSSQPTKGQAKMIFSTIDDTTFSVYFNEIVSILHPLSIEQSWQTGADYMDSHAGVPQKLLVVYNSVMRNNTYGTQLDGNSAFVPVAGSVDGCVYKPLSGNSVVTEYKIPAGSVTYPEFYNELVTLDDKMFMTSNNVSSVARAVKIRNKIYPLEYVIGAEKDETFGRNTDVSAENLMYRLQLLDDNTSKINHYTVVDGSVVVNIQRDNNEKIVLRGTITIESDDEYGLIGVSGDKTLYKNIGTPNLTYKKAHSKIMTTDVGTLEIVNVVNRRREPGRTLKSIVSSSDAPGYYITVEFNLVVEGICVDYVTIAPDLTVYYPGLCLLRHVTATHVEEVIETDTPGVDKPVFVELVVSDVKPSYPVQYSVRHVNIPTPTGIEQRVLYSYYTYNSHQNLSGGPEIECNIKRVTNTVVRNCHRLVTPPSVKIRCDDKTYAESASKVESLYFTSFDSYIDDLVLTNPNNCCGAYLSTDFSTRANITESEKTEWLNELTAFVEIEFVSTGGIKLGFVRLKLCDLKCCRKGYGLKKTGNKITSLGLHISALKTILRYDENGDVLKNFDYNDNIHMYQSVISYDDEAFGHPNSSAALLRAFEKRPEGSMNVSVYLDYLDSYTGGRYTDRKAIVVRNNEAARIKYSWKTVNIFNCRQYVSHPNSMPYKLESLNGIVVRNNHESITPTFHYSRCAICTEGHCDHYEGDFKLVDTDYEPHPDFTPAVYGDMSIRKDLAMRTPVYITTMLPGDLDMRVISGEIDFVKNEEVIQKNSYSVNGNSISIQTIVGEDVKKYQYNIQEIELFDSDQSGYSCVEKYNGAVIETNTEISATCTVFDGELMTGCLTSTLGTENNVTGTIGAGIWDVVTDINTKIINAGDKIITVSNTGDNIRVTDTYVFEDSGSLWYLYTGEAAILEDIVVNNITYQITGVYPDQECSETIHGLKTSTYDPVTLENVYRQKFDFTPSVPGSDMGILRYPRDKYSGDKILLFSNTNKYVVGKENPTTRRSTYTVYDNLQDALSAEGNIRFQHTFSENMVELNYVMYPINTTRRVRPLLAYYKDGNFTDVYPEDDENAWGVYKSNMRVNLTSPFKLRPCVLTRESYKPFYGSAVVYPMVPNRKYVTFPVPIEIRNKLYDGVNRFNVMAKDLVVYGSIGTVSFKHSKEFKDLTQVVINHDENVGSTSAENFIDTFYIPNGNYSTPELLFDKINESVRASLSVGLDTVDSINIKFRNTISVNIYCPTLLIMSDINDNIYNIGVDWDDFDYSSMTISTRKKKKYLMTANNKTDSTSGIVATLDSPDDIFSFKENGTFDLNDYLMKSKYCIKYEDVGTLEMSFKNLISGARILDSMFFEVIIKEAKFMEYINMNGRYKFKFAINITPVEFNSDEIPTNVNYLRLVKDYQNYQSEIADNQSGLTFPEKYKDVEFHDAVDYLSKYISSEKFGLCFKQNSSSLWKKLGIVPVQIDRKGRPHIVRSSKKVGFLEENLFGLLKNVVWYHYLSSDFTETTYIVDYFKFPHKFIHTGDKNTLVVEGVQKLSEYNLMNKKWESERFPNLKLPVRFSIKSTLDEDVELLMNTGKNATSVSDVEKSIRGENDSIVLKINKQLKIDSIDTLYVYVDSSEHYPFEVGVNAVLRVEWIE